MTDLRFTGERLPKRLVKELGVHSLDLVGFDHTDKGIIFDMGNYTTLQTIAKCLNVAPDLIGVEQLENKLYRYHIKEGE